MGYVNIGSGVFLILIGIIIRVFKASWLIAGYNTASWEKKAKYDEGKLIRFVGNLMIYPSFILIVAGIFCILNNAPEFMMIFSWSLYTVLIIVGAIYMNTNKFKKK